MDIPKKQRKCDAFWTRPREEIEAHNVPNCFLNRDTASVIFSYFDSHEIEGWAPHNDSHVQFLRQLNIPIDKEWLKRLANGGEFKTFLPFFKCLQMSHVPIDDLLYMFSWACKDTKVSVMLHIHASNRLQPIHFANMAYLSIMLQHTDTPAFVLWFLTVTNLLPRKSITDMYFINECILEGSLVCLNWILSHVQNVLQTDKPHELLYKGFHAACRHNNVKKADTIARYLKITLRGDGLLTQQYKLTLSMLFMQPDTHVDALVYLFTKCPFTSEEVQEFICFHDMGNYKRRKQLQFLRDNNFVSRRDVISSTGHILRRYEPRVSIATLEFQHYIHEWQMEDEGRLSRDVC